VEKMSSKISEIVKSVDPKDEILKTYPGELDNKYGTLVLSNTRLLFVKEEGFLKKSYTTTLNHFYNEIKKIERKGMRLEFTDMKDKVYVFKSEGTALVVENSLRELIKMPQ
jgi:hypothetical protein